MPLLRAGELLLRDTRGSICVVVLHLVVTSLVVQLLRMLLLLLRLVVVINGLALQQSRSWRARRKKPATGQQLPFLSEP